MKLLKFLLTLPLFLADPTFGLTEKEMEEIGIKINR